MECSEQAIEEFREPTALSVVVPGQPARFALVFFERFNEPRGELPA
jgi:hypothetical protein